MTAAHPFRFGVFSHNTARGVATLIEQACKAEQIGYATFLIPDHIGDQFASALALATIASATTKLRVGSFVFDNDFRHPALLAKDAATLDVLSGGRFELGLGAGWMHAEYEQCGLPFDTPGIRIERLTESVHIIKSLLAQETVNYSGRYYTIKQLSLLPTPVQRPTLPLFLGGSGKRMLSLAAREADIVGFAPRTQTVQVADHMNHALDATDARPQALAQKVEWVRQAAGPRFPRLELNIVVLEVLVTSQQHEGAQHLSSQYNLSPEDIVQTPHFLVGSTEHICAKLQTYREQFGISYWVVWEEYLEAFAPIVTHLTGK